MVSLDSCKQALSNRKKVILPGSEEERSFFRCVWGHIQNWRLFWGEGMTISRDSRGTIYHGEGATCAIPCMLQHSLE